MTDQNSIEGKPRSWLERLSQALLREPQDRAQLIELLRDAEQRELLDEQALMMIEGVLQAPEMQVRDIMIPRHHMITIQENMALNEVLSTASSSGHSRFPVMNTDQDEVVGILLAKDLLTLLWEQDKKPFKLRESLRPVPIVPESKRLHKLLQEFRVNHQHMAIVVDEYGSIAGLVTIEDVLEQIVGEIEDEHDFDDESYIKQLTETIYTIKAITPIEEFNQYFGSTLEENETDTIGGVVVKAFGYLPKRGESTTLGDFRFKVLHADSRRLRLLQLWKKA